MFWWSLLPLQQRRSSSSSSRPCSTYQNKPPLRMLLAQVAKRPKGEPGAASLRSMLAGGQTKRKEKEKGKQNRSEKLPTNQLGGIALGLRNAASCWVTVPEKQNPRPLPGCVVWERPLFAARCVCVCLASGNPAFGSDAIFGLSNRCWQALRV